MCDLWHVLQPGALVQLGWPVVSEEYFEYVDMLSAVLDYSLSIRTSSSSRTGSSVRATESTGGRPFSFIELGAGYGHWSLSASAALEQLLPGAPRHLLLVDVVSSLEPTVRRLGRLNALPADALNWHAGFVTSTSELSKAERAAAKANSRIYEDVWLTAPNRARAVGNATKPTAEPMALTLSQLFRQHGVPCIVDMVDIDIQGGEYDRGTSGLLNSRTVGLLTRRARRVHIGLHGGEPDDAALKRTFAAHGWREVWYFPRGYSNSTPWGGVWFADGVLSFVNDQPIGCGEGTSH